MGEKDITEKILEDYEDVFADIVNVLLFDGEQIVRPECLSAAGVKSQYKANDQKIHEQERDAAKYWIESAVIISFYGLENQTAVDKDIPIRIVGYDGSSYRSQLLSDGTQRYPVVTLVLYYGIQHWNKPLNLKGCMQVPALLEPYVNDYKVNLFEIAWLPEEKIKKFKSDFGVVADFFSQKRKYNTYMPSRQVLRHVDEVLKLLNVMTGDHRYLDALHSNEVRTKKGEISMCTIIDSYIDQGIKKGTEDSRAAILKKAIKGGLPEEQLISVLEFTPEEIKAVKATMSVIKKNPEDFRKQ